ncbi:hypothetical protein SAMN05192575_101632 [Nocardioides alpinus]|uniref:Uncharacterized protein n=1 Tax=Nocardioides alpinus TaxID=748909 RepID=A0A1I0W2E2_9ACTN|nr:hypothetical protein [Nocardioides alpinus]SFA82507.1 hypothetical protein SAMN05192575_101632 [Nocardioides alpinus]
MVEHDASPRHWTRLAAGLAGLTLVTACGSSATPDPDTASPAPSPSVSSEPSPEPETGTETETETEQATPIDGTWTTPTLTSADFRRSLGRERLGVHADAFLEEFEGEVDLSLEIRGGFWTLSGGIDGRAPSVVDRGTVEARNGRVVVSPSSGGENIFRWKLTDGELSLALVSTTEPPYAGVPSETYQVGLYGTSPFRSAP